ncbi:MAG: zinc-ribbon domain-containing protein [Thermoplasmata archaeon]
MKYCPNCGAPNEDAAKFCVGCGSPLGAPVGPTAPAGIPSAGIPQAQTQEQVFFKGEGTLIIRKTRERSGAAKAAGAMLGPIGWVALSGKKKIKTKAEGELIVTNKAIYCAGNAYPFDQLLSLTRHGSKVVEIEFEADVGPGGGGGVAIEAELKMDSEESCNELFQGLQHARTSHLQI